MNNNSKVDDRYKLSGQEAADLVEILGEVVSDYMEEAKNGFFKPDNKVSDSSKNYLPELELDI